ncbi:type 4a pilus biogenesis protein PilO [Leifsonia flava]|uniref:Pilus assembly protein PilO n=1 Tax=Orlajensenia leifsoniae TaxID=2561933 RepID=A0A4Y9R709_9MICO|nr:type 4a pilus biogenesis protein PilO [Leifsonia flava]TFW00121.1 hypothetical protein E4M00_02710 [Leifsonia flava]
MNSRDRLWIIGAVLMAVVILAGGYFLGVSPQLAAASVADSSLQDVELQNAKLQAELTSLAADKAQIDQLNAQAATVSQGLPASADYPTFIRQIDAIAAAAGVTVESYDALDAVAYAPAAAPAAATPDADGGDAAAAAPAEDPAAAPVVAAPATYASGAVTSSNLMTLPITITVSADNSDKLFSFLHGVQFGARQFSVTTVDRTEDNTLTVDGFIYVLLPAGAGGAPAAASAPAG